MEFFTSSLVFDRSKSKAFKYLLGLLSVMIVLVIIMGVWIDGKLQILYGLPLIYLIPAFINAGEKKYKAEVLCYVKKENSQLNLLMNKVIIEKGRWLNRSYCFKDGEWRFETNPNERRLWIIGNGIVNIIDQDNNTVFEQEFNDESIEIALKKSTYEELCSYLGE